MTTTLELKIDGMHCGGCVNRVRAVLQKIEGVEIVSVEAGSAAVQFEPEKAGKQELIDAVNRIGFTARES